MIISDKFKLNAKKVFVIGGSGLIGSEVCKLLSDFGAKVFNLDLKIKVCVNLENSTLIIEDSGIGMTKDDLINKYCLG